MESKLFNDCFGLLWIFVFGAQMNLKKGTSTTKNYMKIVSHILAGFLFVSNQDTPTAQKGQGFGLQLAQATVWCLHDGSTPRQVCPNPPKKRKIWNKKSASKASGKVNSFFF